MKSETLRGPPPVLGSSSSCPSLGEQGAPAARCYALESRSASGEITLTLGERAHVGRLKTQPSREPVARSSLRFAASPPCSPPRHLASRHSARVPMPQTDARHTSCSHMRYMLTTLDRSLDARTPPHLVFISPTAPPSRRSPHSTPRTRSAAPSRPPSCVAAS